MHKKKAMTSYKTAVAFSSAEGKGINFVLPNEPHVIFLASMQCPY
jgi:hypothetical protein